ncbi:MAG: Nucleoside 2-deoxyribosyltransferase [Clostridium butyricum]|nr:Nucleoside 2-deoxyribosyltransferase [Clostridium butyricum]MDN5318010.1 Nucleoside 2-deoxyribosyltransferase [Thermoanaerobacterium sp.]
MLIYLAGALTYYKNKNQFDRALEWREKIQSWCEDNSIQVFNPALTYLKEINHTYYYKLCVDQNRHFLDKADILVVNLDAIDYSPGTIWELTYASEKRKIPIIAIGKKKHWSPHIMYGISHLCKNEDEVIEVLTNMFL